MLFKYPNSIVEASKVLDKANEGWAEECQSLTRKGLEGGESDNCILGKIYGDYWIGMNELFGLDIADLDSAIYCEDNIFGWKANYDDWMKEIKSRLPEEKYKLTGLGVSRSGGFDDAYFVNFENQSYMLISNREPNRCNGNVFVSESGYATLSELQNFEHTIREVYPVKITVERK